MKAPESPDRLSWSSGMPSITNSLTAWTMPVYEMDGDSTFGETSSGGFTLEIESPRPSRARCWLVTCLCAWLVVCGGASIALVVTLQRTPSASAAPTPATTNGATTTILFVLNQCQDAIDIYYSLDARDDRAVVNGKARITLSGESPANVSVRLGASTNATRFVWQRREAPLASYSITTIDGFNSAMSVKPSSEPGACAAVTCLAPLCSTTAVSCLSTTSLEITFCPVVSA
ncbi:hypothetical protein SPRG_06085 [Saprolegnia parasitica CBS 223.65]|uniref:Uncharacterized protein n=1 Tax=Saprolegnia parasitica (strain CBS 223.65) TaxID=695850 RepID=A0A067CIL7_SAPPC|nr:hypothetical protein SPRG_06085 [Saprolegnia parasitica CBS 223.65]KDO29030.1 hypothetical protein SPRG_06085 [Saprolegnia parasitica CBS 223.65]|eukprot:XP_012200200.1 hypothetical protein SPRG_06085 [Saprolegnia parasitica CBS 223.65]